MSETDISICARALVQLGAEPISAFTEGDTGKICANTYPGIKRNLLSMYPWRFLMKKASLTKDSVAPVGEWENSFIMPGDALGSLHAIFDSSEATLASNQFEIFGRRIFTDHDAIIADYVAETAESEWPAYFVEAMVGAVCAAIAFAVTDQSGLVQMWQEKAYGPPSHSGRGGMIGQAMSSDSQADGNIGIVNTEFVDARFGGGYLGGY